MLYSDNASISAGTTADSFGTAVTVSLGDQARRLVGLIISGADPTYTTAEGGAARVRLNSDSIPGLANQDWISGPVTTSGPATNSSGQSCVQDVIPLDYDVKGNEDIDISIAPTTTLTTARLYEVAVQYTDGQVPADIIAAIGKGPIASKGSRTVDASQTTTTETALTAITVPSWAKEVVGCRAVAHKTGAITGGEEVGGFFRLTSTIAGIGVQEYPTNFLGATLGTPVGTGMNESQIPWLPMHIKTPGTNQTITPSINLRTAVTTANRVAFSMAWR
mgnify:CR=1 FL=1